MKSFYILSLAFGLISLAHAQNADADFIPDAEQIQKAIDEFNRSRKNKNNEVTVVLPPPGEPAATPAETEEAAPRAIAVEEEPESETEPEEDIDKKKKPVLVSGKPPETKNDGDNEAPNPDELKTEEDEPEEILAPETPEPSTVRVESIRSGSSDIDPKNIEIKSSFPTKALTQPPTGWKLESTDQAPAFTRQVEIKPGTFISLQITPHLLSPDSDGAHVFSVTEPGYNHQKGYQQDQTVANILESSITQLETDSMKMGSALSELHRLLASLPKPETPVSNTPPSTNP